MSRILFIPIILLLSALTLCLSMHKACRENGNLISVISAQKASVVRGNEVFAISEGGMFRYDYESGETEVFSTVSGLSGISPANISTMQKMLIWYLLGMKME